MDHAGVMNSCDVKAQRLGLQRLTAVERIVVLLSRANFEIELGGLDAFYYKGHTLMVLRQQANEDSAKNKTGFALITKTLDVKPVK